MSKQKLKNATKTGFTIVEVTIVTAFVAMLLIAITVIITQITAIYQKGLTLKAVNSVGRNLVTELTTAINSAPSIDTTSLCNMLVDEGAPRTECQQKGAFKFIYQSYGENNYHDPVTGTSGPVQYAGVFCTGDYSYVWNTYYGQGEGDSALAAGRQVRIAYQETEYGVPRYIENFKLVRFKDSTYRACSNNVTRSYNDQSLETSHEIDMTHQANGNFNEMHEGSFQQGFLEASNLSLGLYELTIFPVSQDWVTLRAFFAGTFILATERGGVSITRTGDYCDTTNHGESGAGTGDGSSNIFNLGSNFNYCGINKFNFAARTAGSGV